MMIMTYFDDRQKQDSFAFKAATHFRDNPSHQTYTTEEIEPNCYFALRYGADNDCVVIFKIGDEEPINYQNIIGKESENK